MEIIDSKQATSHITLENGLRVASYEMTDAKMVSITLRIKTGSILEGPYLGSGISHLLEHSVFLGSEKLPSQNEFCKEIEKMGGVDLNAYTTYDHTCYFFSTFLECLPRALELLSDFIFSALLEKKEVKNEMGTIISEMDMINDKPGYCFYEYMISKLYQNQPYAYSIIGDRQKFLALDNEDLKNYYLATYTPENMVLSLVGQIGNKDAFSLVKHYFSVKKKPSNKLQIGTEMFGKHLQTGIIAETTHPKTKFPKLSITFFTTHFDDDASITLDLLPFFLANDKGSLLYDEIKENLGLVEDVSCFSYTPKSYGQFFGGEREVGYFSFSFDLSQSLRSKEEIISKVREIEEYLEMSLTYLVRGEKSEQQRNKSAWLKNYRLDDLLEGAKSTLIKDFLEEKENQMEVANTLSQSLHYRNDLDLEKIYLEKAKAQTLQDIKEVIRKYLVMENKNIFLMLPTDIYNEGAVFANAQREQINV